MGYQGPWEQTWYRCTPVWPQSPSTVFLASLFSTEAHLLVHLFTYSFNYVQGDGRLEKWGREAWLDILPLPGGTGVLSFASDHVW